MPKATKQNVETGDDMPRDYHIVMTGGQERNIKAVAVSYVDGAVVFENANGEHSLLLAPGTWQYVELETRDDRG